MVGILWSALTAPAGRSGKFLVNDGLTHTVTFLHHIAGICFLRALRLRAEQKNGAAR
jgi:hypothetical protein